ncbi:hypothetical protein SAICODRAFT_206592 [Saitoella complicata NRRL Y-17804]|nr:uncharacterized protein SAICODRAFT_206592 [Saitoella complicata NRRL Y-17804]ODQ54833.1 hypothetical protein SAICODRAFT_206592 [Saitoella complicata NRRL Y-17804]
MGAALSRATSYKAQLGRYAGTDSPLLDKQTLNGTIGPVIPHAFETKHYAEALLRLEALLIPPNDTKTTAVLTFILGVARLELGDRCGALTAWTRAQTLLGAGKDVKFDKSIDNLARSIQRDRQAASRDLARMPPRSYVQQYKPVEALEIPNRDPLNIELLERAMFIWKEMTPEEKEAFQRMALISNCELEGIFQLDDLRRARLITQGFRTDLISGWSPADAGYGYIHDTQSLISHLESLQKTLDLIQEWIDTGRDTRLTLADLKQLHILAMGNARFKSGKLVSVGEFKIHANFGEHPDGKVVFCPPNRVEAELNMLLELYADYGTKFRHRPVLLAEWIHCQFARIHPFEEGSYLVARLLSFMPKMIANTPLTLVPASRRQDYLKVLLDAHAWKDKINYLGRFVISESLDAMIKCEDLMAKEAHQY